MLIDALEIKLRKEKHFNVSFQYKFSVQCEEQPEDLRRKS